jgi:uncharacterized protein
MKVKLFTHTDLDGIGCEIVGRIAFDDIDVTHCDYHNVNDIIGEFVRTGGYYDYGKVYITDISVNEEVAELINNQCPQYFKLIDHHATAEWLNKYDWAEVAPVAYGQKQSGTNLFFEHLDFNPKLRFYDALTIFVEKVRRYDTWDWKEIYNDIEAGELNQLLYLVGRESFANSMVNKFINGDIFSYSDGSWHQMFSKSDRVVIDIDNAKKEYYINKKDKQMRIINFRGNKVGVVFAEQYVSDLGNELSNRHKDLKYIAIIDIGNMKVSLRTIHDDINLGKDVAKLFGGGGHPKASGFQLTDQVITSTISKVFGLSVLRRIVDKWI